MLINREQYENLHHYLKIHQADYKEIYNGYLSNKKVYSDYWDENHTIDVSEHTLVHLYAPNTSDISIRFTEDDISRLLSEDFNKVINGLILDELTQFNIEDYFKNVVVPNIEAHNDGGYLDTLGVHELVMNDGEFFNEIEFYLSKLIKNK